MHITILAGGTSGAAFVGEFADLLGPDDRLSVIVNSAGDLWAHGLKVSPDLDLVLNTLRRRDYVDTFGTSAEIARLGIEPSWLRSSDRDLALHIVRTELLQAGFSLVQVAQALAARMDIAVDVI
ncbi:MAG TPA: 2-phospho-L-lactate transferase CofD family protein, partial [Aeromicrobium sp.]|nr:2-phospho-L-lactate transferase CofD family protein [Aeromicrobium sp.]